MVNTHKKLTHHTGAGAAGSSAAYHLRKYAEEFNVPVNITIFEKTDRIGGRTLTINPYDDPSQRLELGASIFIEKNFILNKSVEEFGLQTKDPDVGFVDDNLGFWDGEKFVFEIDMSRNWLVNMARVIWKYGFSAPKKTQGLVAKTVERFLHLYEEPYFPFKSLTQRAYDLELTPATGATGEEFLKANGVSCRTNLVQLLDCTTDHFRLMLPMALMPTTSFKPQPGLTTPLTSAASMDSTPWFLWRPIMR